MWSNSCQQKAQVRTDTQKHSSFELIYPARIAQRMNVQAKHVCNAPSKEEVAPCAAAARDADVQLEVRGVLKQQHNRTRRLRCGQVDGVRTVSYTHLTLPTICSV